MRLHTPRIDPRDRLTHIASPVRLMMRCAVAFVGMHIASATMAAPPPQGTASQVPNPVAPMSTDPAVDESAPTAKVATLPDDADRLRVDVAINGTPLRFLVDTASTRSVVSSEVASRLNLARGPAVTVKNIGGADRVPSVTIPELRFASLTINDVKAPALFETNLGGQGLIGLNILRDQRLTINFRARSTITIAPSDRHSHVDELPDDPSTIVVTARSKHGELILTNAEIEGQTVSVVIDTGSEDSIGNTALRRLVERQIAHTPIRPVTLLSVTGRTVAADFTQIGNVKIGGLAINNLPIAFADANSFQQFGLARRPSILLGMSALRLFDVVVLDFSRKQVWFRLHLRPKA